jgi:nucleotide-binding universal stress UspA family protein
MAINQNFHGFNSILVDVDALGRQHPALDAALNLATHFQAKVKVVDVVCDVPPSARSFVTPRVEREIVEAHREHLMRLACWRQRPVPVETAILRGAPGLVLVQEVLRAGHDLLVRAHGRDLPDEVPLFGPVDLHLLRTCPCPVWLVGPHQPPRAPHIIAAVDSGATHPDEQALNRDIIERALLLREARGGSMTILHAWRAYGEYLLQPRMTPQVFADFLQRAEQAARRATTALLEGFGERAADVRVNVVEGDPADVIPAIAFETQADLIVMGSMGRTGLAGIFMGNNAERVLRRWQGSVFVVKPVPETHRSDRTDAYRNAEHRRFHFQPPRLFGAARKATVSAAGQ